jgi:hypothetical protein
MVKSARIKVVPQHFPPEAIVRKSSEPVGKARRRSGKLGAVGDARACRRGGSGASRGASIIPRSTSAPGTRPVSRVSRPSRSRREMRYYWAYRSLRPRCSVQWTHAVINKTHSPATMGNSCSSGQAHKDKDNLSQHSEEWVWIWICGVKVSRYCSLNGPRKASHDTYLCTTMFGKR